MSDWWIIGLVALSVVAIVAHVVVFIMVIGARSEALVALEKIEGIKSDIKAHADIFKWLTPSNEQANAQADLALAKALEALKKYNALVTPEVGCQVAEECACGHPRYDHGAVSQRCEHWLCGCRKFTRREHVERREPKG